MMKKINQKGVSLPEMLAIVVVMGLIAIITIPLVGKTIDNAKRKVHLGDAITIVDQVRTYCSANEDDDMNYICKTGDNKQIVLVRNHNQTVDAKYGLMSGTDEGPNNLKLGSGLSIEEANIDIQEFEEHLSNSFIDILGVDERTDLPEANGIFIKFDGDKILIRMNSPKFRTTDRLGGTSTSGDFIDPLDNTKSTKEKILLVK